MKQVQMTLREQTDERIENIKQTLSLENKAEAVARSAELSNIILNFIKDGGTVLLNKNNNSERLIVPGLND